jgi:hypothetical protein
LRIRETLGIDTLVREYGYEITGADVIEALNWTLAAAERHGSVDDVRQRVRDMVTAPAAGGEQVKALLRRLLARAE